jgi:hypothetical protein
MSNQKQSMSSPPPPPQKNVEQEYAKMKVELEEAFKEFHQKYFLSKILDQNKSATTKSGEHAAVDRLVKAATALDNLNVGEGILALAVISLREQLVVRDRVNELEYELFKALKEIRTIKQELGDLNGKKE